MRELRGKIMEKNFLTDIKVGDKVLISSRYTLVLRKVNKITKTMIVLDGGMRFRKDGWLVGDNTWSTTHLIECTDENMKIYYRQFHTREIETMVANHVLEHLSIDELRTISTMLREKIKKS